jgi:hypothetical protein
MMEAETVSEKLDDNSFLTRLISREDFIVFSRRESFKSLKFSRYSHFFNFATFSNDSLAIFMLWFRPVALWKDRNVHLIVVFIAR